MMRIVISIMMILVMQFSVSGAFVDVPTLQLHLAQDILIPGDDLWYSTVSVGETESLKRAIVHISLYSVDQELQFRKSYRSTNGVISDFVTLPYDIEPGSYVLSADIYDGTGQDILLESARTINVVGDPSTNYYSLQEQMSLTYHSINSSKGTTIKSIETRAEICEGTSADQLAIVSSEELRMGEKVLLYSAENTDYQSEYSISLAIANHEVRPFMYSPKDYAIINLSYRDESGQYNATLQDDLINREVQIVDAYSFEPIEKAQVVFPKPKWFSCEKRPTSIAVHETLRIKSENRGLINRVFSSSKTEIQIESSSKTETVSLEDEFVLSDYQAFESLELFIKEVVTPIKLNRHKGKIEIQLVDRENRRFYSDEPLYIVDGRVVSTMEEMLDVPFVEIDKLTLIRSKQYLDTHFGIYGHNGVVMLFTTRVISTDDLISLPSLSTSNYYSNPDVKSSLSTRPVFSNLQFLGVVDKEFCFHHNDELGSFMIRLIDLNTGELRTSSYTVELGIMNSTNPLKD